MATRAERTRDAYGDAPWIDWLLLAAGISAWIYFAHGAFPAENVTRNTFYTATGSLAGIVLAAATFACTQIYQAQSGAIRFVREQNADEYRRGTVGLLASLLLAALLPLVAVVLDAAHPQWAFGIGLSSAGLIALRFLRVAAWVDLGIRGQDTPNVHSQRLARRTPTIRED